MLRARAADQPVNERTNERTNTHSHCTHTHTPYHTATIPQVAAGTETVLRNQGQLLGLQGAASHLVGRIPYFSINKSLIVDVAQVGGLRFSFFFIVRYTFHCVKRTALSAVLQCVLCFRVHCWTHCFLPHTRNTHIDTITHTVCCVRRRLCWSGCASVRRSAYCRNHTAPSA